MAAFWIPLFSACLMRNQSWLVHIVWQDSSRDIILRSPSYIHDVSVFEYDLIVQRASQRDECRLQKGVLTPFGSYAQPSCDTRLPCLSKNRPPPIICGTPAITRMVAESGVRKSMLVDVPCTADSQQASAISGPPLETQEHCSGLAVQSATRRFASNTKSPSKARPVHSKVSGTHSATS